MDVRVSQQKVFLVESVGSIEQALALVERDRVAAFGQVSRVINRSKAEEISVAPVELRYDPIWHAVARRHLVYTRRKRYTVKASDPTVRTVTIHDVDYPVTDGAFELVGVDHCQSDESVESVVDAVTHAVLDVPAVLAAPRRDVGDTVQVDGATVVPPEVRRSTLVQKLLQSLIKPYEADDVLEEAIDVEPVHLLYRPVYVFEARWPARSKTALVEVDGVTGDVEWSVGSRRRGLRGVVSRDLLFDVGAETLSLVVPGGSIAVRIGQAIVDRPRS